MHVGDEQHAPLQRDAAAFAVHSDRVTKRAVWPFPSSTLLEDQTVLRAHSDVGLGVY